MTVTERAEQLRAMLIEAGFDVYDEGVVRSGIVTTATPAVPSEQLQELLAAHHIAATYTEAGSSRWDVERRGLAERCSDCRCTTPRPSTNWSRRSRYWPQRRRRVADAPLVAWVYAGPMGVPTKNWAGNQRCLPAHVHEPRFTDEVATIVRTAAAAGERVKVIGGGHSFTDAAMTDGHLLSLDAMNQVLSVDGNDVTVQAGIRLRDLNEELDRRGLALPNLGDINVQSIAGATSTATHGTGVGFGNLATTIVGLEIVTGDGTMLRADEHHEPELLRVARVGIGALGIVTEVTLRCVPAFNLRAVETIEPLVDVIADFGNVMRSTDHVEFYLMPGARRCQVKRNTRTDEPAQPQSKVGLRARQVDRGEPRVRHRVSCRSSLSRRWLPRSPSS